MTPEERCNQLVALSAKKKWSPEDHGACAEQLSELLGTPEGSRLLESRTEGKAFGRARAFYREAVGQLEDLFLRRPEDQAWASNVRRFAAAIFKASPANWEERWRCLSFLQKTKSGQFAACFLPVFRKDCKKNWNRVVELGESKGLSRKECLGLLEAARSAALERDEEQALETTLTSLRASLPGREGTSPPQTRPEEQQTPVAPAPPPRDSTSPVPASPPAAEVGPPSRATATESPLGDEDLAHFVEQVYLAAVRLREQDRRAVEGELAALRSQVEELRAQVRELEAAWATASKQREAAQAAQRELLQARQEADRTRGEAGELENKLAVARADHARAEEEARRWRQAHEQSEQERQRLDREVKELWQEVEAEAEKLTAINREKESALRTFRFRLWDGLKAYFADVKDEPAHRDGDAADREKFFHRLRLIRDVLRRADVPPT